MKFKFILPSLTEAESPFWRPIKYSLFPPLGLATLAAFLPDTDEAEIVDQHVQTLTYDDSPDVVIIQVYITNAYRAYKIAEIYRKKGVIVLLGGLHVTSLPDEAENHADVIFIGPAEESFPRFLNDLRNKKIEKRYFSKTRTLIGVPKPRRNLINRNLYLVPNSIVVSRGCPHSCNFCYKTSFFKGGRSFYTQLVDDTLKEIESLPGRHLYFLDDHLFGNKQFANDLFKEMAKMGRIFQGAATVKSILDDDLIEKAVEAGLRSLFIGFESINENNFSNINKMHNHDQDYSRAINRLHDLGIMINGSFVFGLDNDDHSVFKRTVDWAIQNGITTSTFHIATPYPGTTFYNNMLTTKRMLTNNWDLFDTRHVTFRPLSMSENELSRGYDYSYKKFYNWSSIIESSFFHGTVKHQMKHFFYTSGWKKFEPLWNIIIQMQRLKIMTPILERVLSKISIKRHNTTLKRDGKRLRRLPHSKLDQNL